MVGKIMPSQQLHVLIYNLGICYVPWHVCRLKVANAIKVADQLILR